MNIKFKNLDWNKMDGLIPAIVQRDQTGVVLMLGYMNQEALQKTIETGLVTFYSRSKKRLWTKGETSGNQLTLVNIYSDCDNDCLLVHAEPTGPVCHLGSQDCFGDQTQSDWQVLHKLENTIAERDVERPQNSYTSELLNAGISRITQKVGEESIEVVIAAIQENDQAFCGEVADLLFHLLVLLRAKRLSLSNVIAILQEREKPCQSKQVV